MEEEKCNNNQVDDIEKFLLTHQDLYLELK